MKLQKLDRTLLGALLISGALGVASQANAAGYCSGGTATGGISTGNVTLNSVNSDDCYGMVSGNINNAADINGLNLTWGNNWTLLADSSTSSSGTLLGLAFTVTATNGTSGSWTLTGTDTNGSLPLNFPASLDFAVGLKASNTYALWGFDNATINGGANSGTFSIVFTNNGGQIPTLSHLIVFGREAGGGTIASVPEPETYAMLLAGLGLVGFAARRKLG